MILHWVHKEYTLIGRFALIILSALCLFFTFQLCKAAVWREAGAMCITVSMRISF
jgi:hypothetical protein